MATSLAAFTITAVLIIIVWVAFCPASLWLSAGAMLGLIAGITAVMRIART